MAATNLRTAMVQIPLPAWSIFCTAMDSGAVPEGEMRTFSHLLFGDCWSGVQTNGAAATAAQVNQPVTAQPRARQASNARNTETKATPRASTRRARSGSKREQLISLIRSSPEGLARGQILEKLGMKGNKSGEMSISNALTPLTKKGVFVRNAGRYCPGPNIGATTQEQAQLADA